VLVEQPDTWRLRRLNWLELRRKLRRTGIAPASRLKSKSSSELPPDKPRSPTVAQLSPSAKLSTGRSHGKAANVPATCCWTRVSSRRRPSTRQA